MANEGVDLFQSEVLCARKAFDNNTFISATQTSAFFSKQAQESVQWMGTFLRLCNRLKLFKVLSLKNLNLAFI